MEGNGYAVILLDVENIEKHHRSQLRVFIVYIYKKHLRTTCFGRNEPS
jgi:hypothetical protein